MSLGGRARESLKEMSAIFSAIEARDAVAARSAARHHIAMAKQAAKQSIDNGVPRKRSKSLSARAR